MWMTDINEISVDILFGIARTANLATYTYIDTLLQRINTEFFHNFLYTYFYYMSLDHKLDMLAINTLRCLSIDMVQEANS